VTGGRPRSRALTHEAHGTRLAAYTARKGGPMTEPRRHESGRIGYLVLYLMGVPIGVLLLLYLVAGNNIFGPG